MSSDRPELLTFDIFGTILDWRTGLVSSCRAAGRPLGPGDFDRVIDAQALLEQGDFLDYATITRRSLVDVLGLDERKATDIGAAVGRWPLHHDASMLRSLLRVVPCAAMTNSDRRHGEDVQASLGFKLSHWLCAEDTRIYKPDPSFWQQMSRLRDIEPGPDWWHVSAYADYDQAVANELGLTTVFVGRPHSRPGSATYAVDGLVGLLDLMNAGGSGGTGSGPPSSRSS